ncbi:hypothetical protein NDU88_003575 [Pleurodeles waltl]|uniref:Uncharacterized protein n=1 Tax=Pleurodeles waltl TaxID=8319 RepID=A0AAV7M7D5_PLEWA|nr:hypothetical protein NDU88_003575 [Pleurodeles waltl]
MQGCPPRPKSSKVLGRSPYCGPAARGAHKNEPSRSSAPPSPGPGNRRRKARLKAQAAAYADPRPRSLFGAGHSSPNGSSVARPRASAGRPAAHGSVRHLGGASVCPPCQASQLFSGPGWRSSDRHVLARRHLGHAPLPSSKVRVCRR